MNLRSFKRSLDRPYIPENDQPSLTRFSFGSGYFGFLNFMDFALYDRQFVHFFSYLSYVFSHLHDATPNEKQFVRLNFKSIENSRCYFKKGQEEQWSWE